jgi:hypothetical protein
MRLYAVASITVDGNVACSGPHSRSDKWPDHSAITTTGVIVPANAMPGFVGTSGTPVPLDDPKELVAQVGMAQLNHPFGPR